MVVPYLERISSLGSSCQRRWGKSTRGFKYSSTQAQAAYLQMIALPWIFSGSTS